MGHRGRRSEVGRKMGAEGVLAKIEFAGAHASFRRGSRIGIIDRVRINGRRGPHRGNDEADKMAAGIASN